ncbi:hypothetical protein [Lewinella sp. 4G2]|uniref:hypothetical protein n=1 Tax=Lewinella sp. 4G2 TaxID=1803372 RepID=UPI0012F9FF23|nr:hypothetical protein [Lewinella sp. 4G2]
MRLTSPTASALLLFLLHLAPACAPNNDSEATAEPRRTNIVVLTDTADWAPNHLRLLTEQFAKSGSRVLTSGECGETAAQLIQRLPWLLQPGVDTFYVDPRLAGPEVYDSLTNYLERQGHPAAVKRLTAKDATQSPELR